MAHQGCQPERILGRVRQVKMVKMEMPLGLKPPTKPPNFTQPRVTLSRIIVQIKQGDRDCPSHPGVKKHSDSVTLIRHLKILKNTSWVLKRRNI